MNRTDPFHPKHVVLGSTGQLGRAYLNLLETPDSRFIGIGTLRSEVGFEDPKSCLEFLDRHDPSVVINAAAYTQVDLAEKEREKSHQINAITPGLIAQWCAKHGKTLVHFSTDYVFSGDGQRPWKESDPTHPLNHYGQTKAEGERRVVQAGGHHLIFRTSWVYDAQGKNFLTTMLKLGAERETLRIVNDQIGAPTYALDLARGSFTALVSALQKDQFPSGIYHLANSGETSWYEFAKAIFDQARVKGLTLKVNQVEPISSSEYPTPAKRPFNSRLDTEKVYSTLGVKLPHWKDSLNECMESVV